jgi:hypothetical protein
MLHIVDEERYEADVGPVSKSSLTIPLLTASTFSAIIYLILKQINSLMVNGIVRA